MDFEHIQLPSFIYIETIARNNKINFYVQISGKIMKRKFALNLSFFRSIYILIGKSFDAIIYIIKSFIEKLYLTNYEINFFLYAFFAIIIMLYSYNIH